MFFLQVLVHLLEIYLMLLVSLKVEPVQLNAYEHALLLNGVALDTMNETPLSTVDLMQ